MNELQSVVKGSPVQGFRTLLNHLAQLWQDDYGKAPLVSIQLKNTSNYSGIITKYGMADGEEIIVLFSASNGYNSRYPALDTCSYILYSQISGITIHHLDLNEQAVQVVTQNKAKENRDEPQSKLGFLRLMEELGQQITAVSGKEIKITADETFLAAIKDYSAAGTQIRNIAKAFKSILSDDMGVAAVREKVDGLELISGSEFSIKMKDKKLHFIYSTSDLSDYSNSEYDLKTKIESYL